MLNINNKLDNFLNEFGFDNNLIEDIFEYKDVSGLYICELIKLDRKSGKSVVYIPTLNFKITAPIFYNRGLNIGEMLLIYLDNDSNGKIIGLHGKSKIFKDNDIDDKDVLKFGNSEIKLNNNSIELVIDDTEYEFKSNGLSILSSSVFEQFQVNLPSLTVLNVQDLDVIGSSIDVKLGSMNGLTRSIPFSSTRPSGFSVNSLFGNIDINSTIGSINVNSFIATNISSNASLNLIGGAHAGIMAPFISNATLGLGAPLLPSPIPAMALPQLINNSINPYRMPLPNAINHVTNKVRIPLP